MPPDSNHELNHREQPVYRPSHRPGGGMDATTRRLAFVAGGIGIVLAALVGGWSLMGHHAGGIPVIEAPTGPERVKPADPGGLQLMGAEPPPANADAGNGPSLAPGPETPDPKALEAQLDRASKAESPAGPPPPVPAPAAVAKPAPAPITPPPAAAPAAAPAASPPAPTPRATGRVEVQLAAMDTDALAHAEWTRLAHKAPALFGDRHPAVTTATRDGKTFYRLRTGGFATIADATAFCARVRAIGAACTIAAF